MGSSCLDGLEGFLDQTGSHLGIAAVNHIQQFERVEGRMRRLERTDQPRLFPNGGRTLPRADPCRVHATIERSTHYRGQNVLQTGILRYVHEARQGIERALSGRAPETDCRHGDHHPCQWPAIGRPQHRLLEGKLMGPTGQGRHDTQNRTVPETVDPGIGKEPEPVDSLCRHT